MASLEELQHQIEAYRSEAGRYRETARAHERGMRDALQQAEVIEARITGMLEAAELLGASARETQDEPRRRTRRLSGHWQKMMQYVHMLTDFDYDDLESAAEAAGHKVGRDTLRSQMSLYRGGGLVEQGENGRFKLTAAGRRAAGIVSSPPSAQRRLNGNEPPSGKSAGGSEADDLGVSAPSSSWVNPPSWLGA
jgi:hypothetical protein